MEPFGSKKVMYAIGMLFLVVTVIFFLPIWTLAPIEIEGISIYTQEEIVQASQINPRSHILMVRKKKALQNIEALPYVEKADLVYQFPNRVKIQVQENKPIGYVKFTGGYLCVDENGQVLEQVAVPYLKLPTIEGLKFAKFAIGETLPLKNDDHFLTVIEIMNILSKYDYQEKIDIIDVSNLEQIHLYVDKLDVIIGNIRDFDKKVRWLARINNEYPMGILDLSYIANGQAILTPLT